MVAKQVRGTLAPDGAQYVTLTDGDGNLGAGVSVTVGDGSGPLTVDGTVTVTGVSTAANQILTNAPITPATATATAAALLGGEYRTTKPTWTNTQQGALQVGTRGSLAVQITAADGTVVPAALASFADATTNSTANLAVGAFNQVFNGTTWDRQVGNTTGMAIQKATTGTQSSVASSATDVTILASNTSRKGATIYNDSTQILYLLVGAGTSSNTVYSVQVPANGYYEVPGAGAGIYTGILKGIWASANGNARVTEWT